MRVLKNQKHYRAHGRGDGGMAISRRESVWKPGGFSLLELLLVVSIMGILMAIAIPSTSTILRGSQLAQGAQILNDQLALARQTALSANGIVEVRFYQFGDAGAPGERADTPASGKYRAMQTFVIQDSGTSVAAGKVQYLPSSIMIDSGAALSSVIGSAQTSPMVPTSTSGAALNAAIPRVGTAYNAVAFRFLPSGSTDLAKTSKWFLTLHNVNDGDALATPPNNFYTLQIDPVNGHIKTYQP